MLHPGPGVVRAVAGLDAARAVPGVRHVALRVGPGSRVPERLGTGQDVGWIEAAGATRDVVASALRRAFHLVRIEMDA
jgi:hypothetical protein